MSTPSKQETILSKRIKDALESVGYLVRRIQSGRVRVRRGWMILAEVGTPDLLVIGNGFMAWCEVKTEDGELNPEQEKFRGEMERRKIPHFTARSEFEAVRQAMAIGGA